MKIGELLTWGRKQVDSHLSIDILLAHTLQQSRSFLYANPEERLSEEQEQQFKMYLARFMRGEPIAYITETREFWSLPLKVNPDTLIPRQETELLVELALQLVASPDCLLADLGTGSGAIALAIGHERPSWKIIATDQSVAALKVAEENAKKLNIQNVKFVQKNWFEVSSCHSRADENPFSTREPLTEWIPVCAGMTGKKFDLIISNPPYLAEEELHSGISFEPRTALVAKESGLSDIRHVAYQSWHYLKKTGSLLIEHGHTQGEKVRSIFLEVGYNDIQTERDLMGLERITWGRRG